VCSVFSPFGYKPWDIEKLYDYDVDTSSAILEGHRSKDKEQRMTDAYYAWKIAFHVRDNKSFKFDDFTDLLGENFMQEIEKQKVSETRARIEYLKAHVENY
jgi:hypothetical protein